MTVEAAEDTDAAADIDQLEDPFLRGLVSKLNIL